MKHHIQALQDIVREMRFLLENIKNQADVRDDPIRSRAAARSLQIIGDATKRVPDSLKLKHPDVPWRSMAGMRDVVVHEYDEIDPGQVWETLHNDIPKTLPKIEKLLESERQ